MNDPLDPPFVEENPDVIRATTQAEDVTGYIYTHFDCPECGQPGEVEGDASGDTVRCTACGFDKIKIYEVR